MAAFGLLAVLVLVTIGCVAPGPPPQTTTTSTTWYTGPRDSIGVQDPSGRIYVTVIGSCPAPGVYQLNMGLTNQSAYELTSVDARNASGTLFSLGPLPVPANGSAHAYGTYPAYPTYLAITFTGGPTTTGPNGTDSTEVDLTSGAFTC